MPSDLSTVTPAAEMLAQGLIRQYRCEASIEALARYHDHRDAGEVSRAELYRDVLALFGVAEDLIAHRPSLNVLAELYRGKLELLTAMQCRVEALQFALAAAED